ncbi:MAG: hypothetical protein LUQ65_10600, partial [Candidatus Helarchaeota archaeon]|nr:hypothetical protein [Candidatus Helarchaeota archaeon]
MDHFLTKLIHGAADLSAHRRFIKFSKGEFPDGGPVLRIKAKKNSLTLNGSFEYEDLMGYFVALHLPEGSYKVEGDIYTQPHVELEEIQGKLKKVSLPGDWEPGKRDLKNLFVYPMNTSLTPKELVQLYDNLADDCYLLLTISGSGDWKFKSDDKIPKLKKIFGKAEAFESCNPDTKVKCKNTELCEKTGICITDRTKFCNAKTATLSSQEIEDFFKLLLPDFPELPRSFEEIFLVNKYSIINFIFPDDKDSISTRDLREKIKKVGFLERIVYMDEKVFSKKIEFTV